MPYHPRIEAIYEEAKGLARTGTTKRGMGPVFADKASYNGITFFDLGDEALVAGKLKLQLNIKNTIFKAFGGEALEYQAVFDELMAAYEQLKPAVREPFGKVQELAAAGGKILLEGAQGALLDNTWGTYPYCTASTTTVGGACAGLGLAPQHITKVVGVAKAYTTRVGGGPMPTELDDANGKVLLEAGQEYGTVTGRPRRCGWFDAEIVRFTSQLNGVTDLALTKLDVLDTLETIKIAVGYRMRGKPVHYWEVDAHHLEECHPEYIEVEGWRCSTTGARHFEELPAQAQAYVKKIEELVGAPVSYISVGPERQATIAV
jgi:adenylosuccinate synthase